MSGDFTARIDELRKKVGSGRVTATVTVDQVYLGTPTTSTNGSTSVILAAEKRSTSSSR